MALNAQTTFLARLRQIAKRTLPEGTYAVLYGSRARGDYREDSDWDILIVLDKESIENEDYDNFSYPLVESGFPFDQTVIPILMTKKEWENIEGSIFRNNIVRNCLLLI